MGLFEIILLVVIGVLFVYVISLVIRSKLSKTRGQQTTRTRTPNSLAIAGINVAVLSLIIASLGAYAIYLFGKIDELEAKVFQEANKINTLPIRGHNVIGSYDLSTNGDIEKQKLLLIELQKINQLFRDDKVGLFKPQNAADTGQITIAILSNLRHDYPFPRVGKPIILKNLDDIRQWISRVRLVSGKILSLKDDYGSILQANVDAHNQEVTKIIEDKIIKTYKNPQSLVAQDFRKTFLRPLEYEEYIKDFSFAWDTAVRTEVLLGELQTYRDRRFNKPFIQFLLVLCGLTFLSGVIVPLIKLDTSYWLLLVIPGVFYLFIFVSIVYFVNKS